MIGEQTTQTATSHQRFVVPKVLYLQQRFMMNNAAIQKRWVEDCIKINQKQKGTIVS